MGGTNSGRERGRESGDQQTACGTARETANRLRLAVVFAGCVRHGGATAGLLAGFGWVMMRIGVVSLFERRPWTNVIVNGGYLTVALVLMGAILGGWR